MEDSVEKLRSIAALTTNHGDRGLATWLSAGVEAFLAGDDLGRALGLTGASRLVWQHRERNRLLCEAGHLVTGDGTWARAANLAPKVRAVYRIWPRLRLLDMSERPPADRLRLVLCEAFDLGLEIPLTTERLYQILLKEHQVIKSNTKSAATSSFVDPV
jgi:hypothetical protein